MCWGVRGGFVGVVVLIDGFFLIGDIVGMCILGYMLYEDLIDLDLEFCDSLEGIVCFVFYELGVLYKVIDVDGESLGKLVFYVYIY